MNIVTWDFSGLCNEQFCAAKQSVTMDGVTEETNSVYAYDTRKHNNKYFLECI